MKSRLNDDNTAVVAEAYSHAMLKKDVYPSTIPALDIFTPDMWAEHNVFDVVENEPDYDPATQKVVSTGVAVENGLPVRQYSVISLTEDELTAMAEEASNIAEVLILSDFLAEVSVIQNNYTQAEINTFPIQEAEANAYSADNTAPTPLLDAIVAASLEPKADLVARILIKAAEFKTTVGTAIGNKNKVVV